MFLGVSVMMYNVTFNNISVISWRLVLLIEESGVPGENYQLAASRRQTSITLCCIKYISPWVGLELTTLVMIGTECTGSSKFIYHTIMTTMFQG